jgi:hypothetical protein
VIEPVFFAFHRINSRLVTPVASRSTTPIENDETFDPAHPSVNPGDSVLLPKSKVPIYLDAVLKALGLHTEARTSFITLRIFFITHPPSFSRRRGSPKILIANF